jgi:hypothetical protein
MSGELFSPSATAKAVHATLDEALTAIPEGKSHAVIFDGTYDTASGGAVRALFVQRAPDGWNIVLAGDYSGPGGVSGQVAVAKAW